MTRHRTRMISFRVSEQEFELLKARSEAEGARNISEYARLSLCCSDRAASLADATMSHLSEEIQQLREQLLYMSELLTSSPQTASGPPYTRHTTRGPEVHARTEPRSLQLATTKTRA